MKSPKAQAMANSLNRRDKIDIDFTAAMQNVGWNKRHVSNLYKARNNHSLNKMKYVVKKHRLYYNAMSLQNIPGRLRNLIFTKEKNYYDIDISNCHLSILAGKFPKVFPTVHKILSADKSVYDELREYGTKEQIKNVINPMLFGAEIERQVISFADNLDFALELWAKLKSKDGYQQEYMAQIRNTLLPQGTMRWKRLAESPLYIEIKEGLESISDIKFDAYGNELTGKPATNIHIFCCSWEKEITYHLYKKANLLKYNVILDMHDGCVIQNLKRNHIDKIITELNKEVKAMGFPTKFVIKN